MLTLLGARVIDPVTRTVGEPRSLHIADGRILDSPPAASDSVEQDRTLDCTGKFVMPGMIDSHVHVKSRDERLDPGDWPDWSPEAPSDMIRHSFERALHSYLRCGVTSLYDAGNNADVIYGLRRWGQEGSLASPRIHCTGRMLTSVDGHGATVGTFVDEDTDIEALVATHLSNGPDLVKIAYDEHNWGVRPLITILSKDLLRRLIDALHEAGQRVITHASSELRCREVIAAGADVLAHPVIQSPVTHEFVDLVAELQVPVVSTLAIGERYFRLIADPDFAYRGLYATCGDPEAGLGPKPAVHGPPDHQLPWADWMRVMTPIAQTNLRLLAEAGAVVAAGTDRSFGPDFHRELELLQGAGIEPWDVIRSATHHGALVLGREGELGSVQPGALADLLVLGQDPTTDIRNLESIEQVLVGGEVIDQESLDLATNS